MHSEYVSSNEDEKGNCSVNVRTIQEILGEHKSRTKRFCRAQFILGSLSQRVALEFFWSELKSTHV